MITTKNLIPKDWRRVTILVEVLLYWGHNACRQVYVCWLYAPRQEVCDFSIHQFILGVYRFKVACNFMLISVLC